MTFLAPDTRLRAVVWHVTDGHMAPGPLSLHASDESVSWEGVSLSVSTCPGAWASYLEMRGQVHELRRRDGLPGRFATPTKLFEMEATAWASRRGWLDAKGAATAALMGRWRRHFRGAEDEPRHAAFFAEATEPMNLYVARNFPLLDGLWWDEETDAGPPRGSLLPHALPRWSVVSRTPIASWSDVSVGCEAATSTPARGARRQRMRS